MSFHYTPRGLRARESVLARRLGAKGWQKVLKSLTFREKPQRGMPAAALNNLRTHRCYEREDGWVLLPRRWGALFNAMGLFTPEEWGGLKEEPGWFGGEPRPLRRLSPQRCELGCALYPYQEAYVDRMEQLLGEGPRREGSAQLYVKVDTGLGKTVMVLALAARLRVPTLVVVPTEELRAKGMEDARMVVPGLQAAAYSDAAARRAAKRGEPAPGPETADIVYCIVNTARKKPPSFYRGYGLVVLDEAHEYHSPVSSQLLLNAQAPCIVGLSATPLERKDEMDRVVTAYLGKPLPLAAVVPADQVEKVEFRGRVREVRYRGHPDHCFNVMGATGTVSAIGTIARLMADPHRLELVAAEVERLLYLHEELPAAELGAWGLGEGQRHGVLVFAEHREYLPALKVALERRLRRRAAAGGEEVEVAVPDEEADGGPPPASAALLRGGARAAERETAKRARAILTTYAYSRRGVSYDHMTALVEATPRRSGFTQILGRVCRLGPDEAVRKVVRVVVDVRDVDTALNSQSSDRRAAYRARKWPVWSLERSWTDYPTRGEPAAAPPAAAEKPARGGREPFREEHGDESAPFTCADLVD